MIGAGPAGLAVAGELERAGMPPTVLERFDVAGSWRRRYDRLHLNTSTWFSYLPGQRFPRTYPRFPSRDQLVEYYEGFARSRNFDVRSGVEVERVARCGEGWRLTSSGGPVDARVVVVATGKDHTPKLPDVPGAEAFAGRLLHAADYRNAQPFRGDDALVLGAGNSGVEIATDLAEGGAKRVRLSVRTPPNMLRRSMVGLPNDLFALLARPFPPRTVDAVARQARRMGLGDLSQYGLPIPPEGPYSRLRRTGMIPTVTRERFLRAVKSGAIEVVAGLERFDGAAVELSSGERFEPDVVVAATGYRTNLEPLVGHLGVLDERGRPRARPGETDRNAPGLHFIGFTDPLSGNIRQVRLDASKIAAAVAGGSRPRSPRPAT